MASRPLARCGTILSFVDLDDGITKYLFGLDATYLEITELAGQCEYGETPEATAWRETSEESLGLFPHADDRGTIIAYIEGPHGHILGQFQRIYLIALTRHYSAIDIMLKYFARCNDRSEVRSLLPLSRTDILWLLAEPTDRPCMPQLSRPIATYLNEFAPPNFYLPTHRTVRQLLRMSVT